MSLPEDYPEPDGYRSSDWAGWYFYQSQADADKAAEVATVIVNRNPELIAKIESAGYAKPGSRVGPVEISDFDGRYIGMYGVCVV